MAPGLPCGEGTLRTPRTLTKGHRRSSQPGDWQDATAESLLGNGSGGGGGGGGVSCCHFVLSLCCFFVKMVDINAFL